MAAQSIHLSSRILVQSQVHILMCMTAPILCLSAFASSWTL